MFFIYRFKIQNFAIFWEGALLSNESQTKCYDNYFQRFSSIWAKIEIFLKTNVTITFSAKLAVFCQKGHHFSHFIRRQDYNNRNIDPCKETLHFFE
jgi:hypothetical protein